MQPAHSPEDLALSADLQRFPAQLVGPLPGPAAGELHALVRDFGRLRIGTCEELQEFVRQNCPHLHPQLQPCQLIGLFATLRFLSDPHRFSASVSAVRRYVLAHERLYLVLQAMEANGGADARAIARFFALLMQLHTRVSGARLVRVVLEAIANLPGTSAAALETGSGMTLATAARLLLVHHVLGTKPCRKPNRKSASLSPKRRRPVYEDFMEAARSLPSVDRVLTAMYAGGSTSPVSSSSSSSSSYPPSYPVAAAAPSFNVHGRRFREEWSSEADYSDGGSSGSGSFVDDEQPRSKSPRTVWEFEEYESKNPDVEFVFNAQEQEQVEQEIFSQGLFHGLDNGFGFGQQPVFRPQLPPLPFSPQLFQQPVDAAAVQQTVEDLGNFDGLVDILALGQEEVAQLFDALDVNDDDNNVADGQQELDEFTQDLPEQELDEFTQDLPELELDQLVQFLDEDYFDAGNNETRGAGSY